MVAIVVDYIHKLDAIDPTSIAADEECPCCLDPYGQEPDDNSNDANPDSSDSIEGFLELPFVECLPTHEPVKTECGHVFGRQCLIMAVTRKDTCPMCRSSIRMDYYRWAMARAYEHFRPSNGLDFQWHQSPEICNTQLVILPRSFREGFKITWAAQLNRMPPSLRSGFDKQYEKVASAVSALLERHAFVFPPIQGDSEEYRNQDRFTAPLRFFKFSAEVLESIADGHRYCHWTSLLTLLSLEHLFKWKAFEQHGWDAKALLQYEREDPSITEAHKDTIDTALKERYPDRTNLLDPFSVPTAQWSKDVNLMMSFKHQWIYYQDLRYILGICQADLQTRPRDKSGEARLLALEWSFEQLLMITIEGRSYYRRSAENLPEEQQTSRFYYDGHLDGEEKYLLSELEPQRLGSVFMDP